MRYQGYVDAIAGRRVRGWAFDTHHPGTTVRLELLADGHAIDVLIAEQHRPDLESAGIGTGRHGFNALVPDHYWGKAHLAVRVLGTDHLLVDSNARDALRHRERFNASLIEGLPAFDYRLSTGMIADDVAIAEEMLALWPQELRAEHPGSSIWAVHQREKFAELTQLLERRDANALARFLLWLPTKRATEGILQGAEAYESYQASPQTLSVTVAPFADALVSLAQYIGVANLETPEQGPLGRSIHADLPALSAACEAHLGTPVVPPQVFSGLLGLAFPAGVLHERDVYALYAARRAARLCGPGRGVLEIGGGLGQLAYHAWLAGVRQYCIIDLPLVSMLQYYTLRKSLPDTPISMITQGEGARTAANGVTLVWATSYSKVDYTGFDVAINCDSFPEMGDDICLDYIQMIARTVRHLISINQEAGCPLTGEALGPRQSIVREIVAKVDGLRLRDRMRTWIRRGYVEEHWEVRPPTS